MVTGIMKIDELLKRLENIEINENKIDEKREIAEYLAQTFGDDKVLRPIENFMMKDRRVYGYNSCLLYTSDAADE